ncbi:hypothetical protein MARPU_11640 [Marichromatium purpuratum 984]|uniref:DUF7931 domain-containing protein n=1 Tax=Marichromatium purpuratum 984 TaxID=765910 RepID=W0E4E9_MARPU|nr:hypothetical protein [Marichromatium purpuratum]AHF04423.1 hypothetical protein MARPU_11640 [Marichromatium purpuratum 984]
MISAHIRPQPLETRTSIRDAGIALATQARRELLIFGPHLEPDLYDQPPLLEAIRRLALERPDLPVRILLNETRNALQQGPRLVELARRLTSRIAIRRSGEDDRTRIDAFLVVDTQGYVQRQRADGQRARTAAADAPEARRLRETFMQMWARSDNDSEIERLYL